MDYNQKPDNYLVWAILATVLCCVPLGIVSIVKSTKVDSLWNAGQHNEAYQAANDAKKWAIIAAASGLIFAVIYFIFCMIVGFASAFGY